MNSWVILKALLLRETKLALHRRANILTVVFFYIMIATLFAVSMNGDAKALQSIAPSALWVSALFAIMLSLNHLFTDDFTDKTIEQLLLAPAPLSMLVAIKIFVQWLTSAFPLILATPFLGIQFGMGAAEIGSLLTSLLLGTPTLTLIGAIGAALTLGTKGSSILIAVLIFPLYIPTLIFGSSAANATLFGHSAEEALVMLAALLIIGIITIPYAVAVSLRIALE